MGFSDPSVDPDTPVGYFKSRILPTLQPILHGLVEQILSKDILLKHHSAFNALDYITLECYRTNPAKREIEKRVEKIHSLGDIPWVADHWKTHPRRSHPLSWDLSFAEAATVIQKHWRGYLVRRLEEVQELRRWQREWRLEVAASAGRKDT
uniref:IQ domain-containing protein K n=1 Tax=Mesocestoides corti TaxID=53468 RepID=A0A5K3EQE4_MESCO